MDSSGILLGHYIWGNLLFSHPQARFTMVLHISGSQEQSVSYNLSTTEMIVTWFGFGGFSFFSPFIFVFHEARILLESVSVSIVCLPWCPREELLTWLWCWAGLCITAVWPVEAKLQLFEECTSGWPLAFPNYMYASNTKVSHTLPLGVSSSRWCHLISWQKCVCSESTGRGSGIKASSVLFSHWGKTTDVFLVWFWIIPTCDQDLLLVLVTSGSSRGPHLVLGWNLGQALQGKWHAALL